MSNYSKLDAGRWDDLSQHVFRHGKLERAGKLFLSESLGSSGCEISLNRIEPGEDYPFLHKHHQQEEIYIVVSGKGDMLVDGEVIPLQEGTAMKIDPQGVRSIRAAADSQLSYLCIQATKDSLTERSIFDGEIVPGEVCWETSNV